MALLRIGGSPTFAGAFMLHPGAIAANTVSAQTFTVNGLDVDGIVFVNAPNLEAGLIKIDESITGQNTLAVKFWNTTNLTITPALQLFTIYQP